MSHISDPNSDIERIDLQSFDAAEQKRQELLRLFPEVRTDTMYVSQTERCALIESGFIVIPGPVAIDALAEFAKAYDAAVASADPNDIAIGSTTTRLHDFVNRGPAFDPLYIYPPTLAACELVINQPFKLSTLLARTLRPQTPAQNLHADYAADEYGWPMVGFIFMVDEFRRENGATRFVPGSHLRSKDGASKPPHMNEQEVCACGPVGSLILYNGSVWHGHGANVSNAPRRSIQASYIRRSASAATDFQVQMRPETRSRLTTVARQILAM